jgi:hypothetical protein
VKTGTGRSRITCDCTEPMFSFFLVHEIKPFRTQHNPNLTPRLPHALISSYNPFRSYVRPRPILWFSCSRCFSLSLTLSNPIFLPPAYSPALIYFGRVRGGWVTCNYPTVLKEKNIKRTSTTWAICWLKSVLHEEKRREQEDRNVEVRSSDMIFLFQTLFLM